MWMWRHTLIHVYGEVTVYEEVFRSVCLCTCMYKSLHVHMYVSCVGSLCVGIGMDVTEMLPPRKSVCVTSYLRFFEFLFW